ncbi:MAG: hypothetical protein L6R39_003305 [Caloplaca ligustica]|nr:MAG: hypothetical protein L6R39_003305 [Caloplaca ligustica]
MHKHLNDRTSVTILPQDPPQKQPVRMQKQFSDQIQITDFAIDSTAKQEKYLNDQTSVTDFAIDSPQQSNQPMHQQVNDQKPVDIHEQIVP